jgi:hypothetical protein
MKLNKDSILVALGHSSFFIKLSSLIETYPWNNFLHLKAIALYEDLFESPNTAFRKEALQSSNIGPTLVTLANKANFDHNSGRSIRQGYMAVIVKIANLIVKSKAKEEVAEYIDTLGEDWTRFVEGELKKSNDTNTRSLGGQQPRQLSNDDDEMEGSLSMDSILSRFTNFSTERSKRETTNDEDDEDDEEDEEDNDENEDHKLEAQEEPDEDRLSFLKDRDEVYHKDGDNATHQVFVTIEKEPLVEKFTDSSYWKVEYIPSELSIEEMMAEMGI